MRSQKGPADAQIPKRFMLADERPMLVQPDFTVEAYSRVSPSLFMGRSARPLNGASLIAIAIRVAASEPAAAFYRPSGGIGVGIGTVQLAGALST